MQQNHFIFVLLKKLKIQRLAGVGKINDAGAIRQFSNNPFSCQFEV